LILLSLLLTVLAGCAGQDRIEPPDWSIAELPASEITRPTQLPALCEVSVIQSDGIKYAAFSADCLKSLQAYEIIAEANTLIAESNADALQSTERGYNSLVEAGKMQQELSDYFREELADEKKKGFYDSMFYRALIALGLIVVAL